MKRTELERKLRKGGWVIKPGGKAWLYTPINPAKYPFLTVAK